MQTCKQDSDTRRGARRLHSQYSLWDGYVWGVWRWSWSCLWCCCACFPDTPPAHAVRQCCAGSNQGPRPPWLPPGAFNHVRPYTTKGSAGSTRQPRVSANRGFHPPELNQGLPKGSPRLRREAHAARGPDRVPARPGDRNAHLALALSGLMTLALSGRRCGGWCGGVVVVLVLVALCTPHAPLQDLDRRGSYGVGVRAPLHGLLHDPGSSPPWPSGSSLKG